MKCLFAISMLIFNLFEMSHASYTVRISLLEYQRQADSCCDKIFFACASDCDVFLRACLQDGGERPKCAGGDKNHRVDDTHGFLFNDQSSMRGFYSFTWRNIDSNINGNLSLVLLITAFDYDQVGSNPTLGTTKFHIVKNGTFTTIPSEKQLRVRFQTDITCDDHYYGVTCSKRCIPNANQICDESGDLQCRTHRYGNNCSVICVPNGNLSCDDNGHYVCNVTHCGPDCCGKCVAFGNFVCLQNETKICKDTFFGQNCSKQCIERGNMICDSLGNLKCKTNYIGENCTEFITTYSANPDNTAVTEQITLQTHSLVHSSHRTTSEGNSSHKTTTTEHSSHRTTKEVLSSHTTTTEGYTSHQTTVGHTSNQTTTEGHSSIQTTEGHSSHQTTKGHSSLLTTGHSSLQTTEGHTSHQTTTEGRSSHKTTTEGHTSHQTTTEGRSSHKTTTERHTSHQTTEGHSSNQTTKGHSSLLTTEGHSSLQTTERHTSHQTTTEGRSSHKTTTEGHTSHQTTEEHISHTTTTEGHSSHQTTEAHTSHQSTTERYKSHQTTTETHNHNSTFNHSATNISSLATLETSTKSMKTRRSTADMTTTFPAQSDKPTYDNKSTFKIFTSNINFTSLEIQTPSMSTTPIAVEFTTEHMRTQSSRHSKLKLLSSTVSSSTLNQGINISKPGSQATRQVLTTNIPSSHQTRIFSKPATTEQDTVTNVPSHRPMITSKTVTDIDSATNEPVRTRTRIPSTTAATRQNKNTQSIVQETTTPFLKISNEVTSQRKSTIHYTGSSSAALYDTTLDQKSRDKLITTTTKPKISKINSTSTSSSSQQTDEFTGKHEQSSYSAPNYVSTNKQDKRPSTVHSKSTDEFTDKHKIASSLHPKPTDDFTHQHETTSFRAHTRSTDEITKQQNVASSETNSNKFTKKNEVTSANSITTHIDIFTVETGVTSSDIPKLPTKEYTNGHKVIQSNVTTIILQYNGTSTDTISPSSIQTTFLIEGRVARQQLQEVKLHILSELRKSMPNGTLFTLTYTSEDVYGEDSQIVTHVMYTWNCTSCTADHVLFTNSVRSVFRQMKLKQYNGSTTDVKKTVLNKSSDNVPVISVVIVAVFVIAVTVIACIVIKRRKSLDSRGSSKSSGYTDEFIVHRDDLNNGSSTSTFGNPAFSNEDESVYSTVNKTKNGQCLPREEF